MKTKTIIIFYAMLTSILVGAACGSTGKSDPDDPTLERTAAQFVQLLEAQKYEEAVEGFDAVMTKTLSAKKLGDIWEALPEQLGAFQKQAGTRSELKGEYVRVFVTCQFEKNVIDMQLTFNKKRRIAGLFFVPSQSAAAASPKKEFPPPPYAVKDSFHESTQEVGSGDWTLPATLTLPQKEGPFPAIILVHGSGPNDRDETIGPNKPFRDLAWGLASQGIAVLRYEKRTKEHAAKMVDLKNSITVFEETLEDALAAVELLKKNTLIDHNRIFILGHSLGGMLVPRLAGLDKDKAVAGFVVLAGPTRALEDVVPEQYEYILSLDGGLSDEEQETLDKINRQTALAKSSELSKDTPAADLPLGIPAAYWLDLRGYRPADEAVKMTRPLLILQGERDYQVTMEDFKGWQAALASHKNVTFKSFPSLNHLFIAGEGKSSPGEYQLAGFVEKEVIDTIGQWVKR